MKGLQKILKVQKKRHNFFIYVIAFTAGATFLYLSRTYGEEGGIYRDYFSLFAEAFITTVVFVFAFGKIEENDNKQLMEDVIESTVVKILEPIKEGSFKESLKNCSWKCSLISPSKDDEHQDYPIV